MPLHSFTTNGQNAFIEALARLRDIEHLNAEQLRRLLVEHLTQKKLGLTWETSAIARDKLHDWLRHSRPTQESLQ